MLDFNKVFEDAPRLDGPPKKNSWESAFKDVPITQPVDNTRVAPQPSKAQLLLQPYLDKGLDPTMALEAAKEHRTNQVNSAVNLGMDMVNHNPIGALTMDPDKFRSKVKDSGAFGSEDVAAEAESEIRKTVPIKMGADWFQRQYEIKDQGVKIAGDVHDEIGEQLTKDAYDYSNKFLSEADRQMATINQQIKAEKEKTTEDGYDAGKIKDLYLQLSALGKTYTDENGDVIDVAKATPEQKQYMKTVDGNVIELTKLKESEGGEKKLKDAYFEQYKFVRALDELYDQDVDPWLQEQIKNNAGPTSFGGSVNVMPKGMKQIVDQRRDATAKLAALSKLYLSNTSPANIKKNFKYSVQSTAKGLATGLLGKAMTSALQDQLGPTERDMLDAAQSIMNSKGLEVSPETQKTFDRTIGEYANEGGSQMMGMLPLLGAVGGATNALKVASGLEKLIVGWKAGGDIAKVGATMAEMAVEELKLAGVGFAPGTGSGFVLAGKVLPSLSLKNPIANALLQFMVKPAIITSSMYGARVTESVVESMFSYKDFNDILSEKFGDKKELIGTALSNFMFGFGNKAITPDKYKGMLDHATELRKAGSEKDAVWLEQQVGAYKKMDKASGIAYRKGKNEGLTQDQIYEKMKAAESEAAGKAAAETQVTLEQQNLLERTVPPERLYIVMRGSKMRDAEGNLQVYWHGTDNVFNRFSKVGNKTSTGSQANSRSGKLTFFAENPDMAKSFGSNTERRYLNFKNPIEVGNVRKLNDVKIADLEKKGYDGITGWETRNGVKEKVAAAFGTQGIVKADELQPFKSKNAETLRSWADQLRSKQLNLQDVTQGSLLPVSMAKFEKAGIEVMAKTLEIAGDVVEAVAKGFAYIQETGWYKQLTPEDRAKFDPDIRARLQKLLEESKPEAVAKYDLEKAQKMQTEATSKYLPDFINVGEVIANKLGGKFISDVKTAENIVSKKKRAGLSDVLDVPDVVRGALIVSDMKEFKKTAKALKDLGYDIHNKRGQELGPRVYATKQNGELGTEIQIHTQETWDAQQKAEKLTNQYRDTGKPVADPVPEGVDPKTLPPTQYEQDMAASKALYDEAYSGLENINLEGSPAKTPLEKKMAAMEIPVSQQKELNKAWTETKQTLLESLKNKNTDIKEQFKSFIDAMQIGKLGIPLKKAMLNHVNKIDYSKPSSLENAIDYFDKVIGDASFKYEVIATQKVLNNLDQRTSETFLTKRNSRGLMVNKIGPSGLPLHDELKSIRKDMTEGDWNQGQAEIRKIFAEHANEAAPEFSLEEVNKIAREELKGLLNNTNGAERSQMEGALRILKGIIKTGKSEAAARQMIMKAQMDEHNANVFRILTANGKKPVKTGSMEKANVTENNAAHLLMWYKTSNWSSLMDIFSQYDSPKYMGKGKGSIGGESIISREMVGAVRDADAAHHRNTDQVQSEVQNNFKQALGIKTDAEARKAERENSTHLHLIEYTDKAGVEKDLRMTRNQALKVWMELQDPTLQKSNESPSYKEELVGDRLQKVEEHDAYMRDGELTDLGKKVTMLVTPELQKWGQWQLDVFYPEYWPRINEVYRNKFGLDMPLNKRYSPIFVAGKFGESKVEQDNLLAQQNIISTSTNANLISRVNHGQKLALMDANKVMQNYIDKMEFFINWTDALDLTNGTFMRNQPIRDAIKQNFGKGALQTVEATIKDFGRAPRDVRYAGEWINTVKNNLTVASLALKPNVFFSQLSSQPAYIDKIGIKEWVKNNPFNNWEGTKKAFENMKSSEYWKMRYGEGGGWDWTVMERMREDVNKLGGSTRWQELKNQSMFLTKYGDMFSVITGGIPVYKYYYDKVLRETGNETFAKTVAIREFADITDKSQQAGHVYDLSQVQRDPILKMATMYATAGMQYHRNVTTAFRNGLLHTFDPEARRGSYSSNLKTLVMYHVVLPSLYQFAANGFQWDNKDQLRAAIIGNFSEVFVAGDILTGLMNSVRGLPWDYQFSPLENIVVVGKKATTHATSFAKSIADEVNGVTWDQLGKAAWDAAQVIGSVTGTPVNAVESKIAAVDDIVQGKTKHPVGRIIGWSESVMSGNIGTIKDNETIMNPLNYIKPEASKSALPLSGIKPLPSSVKKPLPGLSKSKSIPIQKSKPLPKN